MQRRSFGKSSPDCTRTGGCSLGSIPTPHVNTSTGKARCQLVQEEVRAAVEEKRACKMVWMRQQEAWSRWENAVKIRVMWVARWRAAPQWIKFLRGSSPSTRDWGAASKSISVSRLRLAARGLQPDLYPEPSSAGALKEGSSTQASTR